MDILRRFEFADFRTAPQLNIDNPELEIVRGIFQSGFFQKMGNALHSGVEAIRRNPALRDKLIAMAPAVAKFMMSKIPGGAAVAPFLAN